MSSGTPGANLQLQLRTYYRPLDHSRKEIRLLNVKPGRRDDIICCSFEHAILSQEFSTPYETISYVWGDAKLRGSVHLHDQPTDVPLSTETVLRQMRYKDRERILWIDAICINQTDFDERNRQVAMMADIYGMTSTNLIWLGEDDDISIEKANANISSVLKDMRNETSDFQELTKQIYGTWGDMLYSDRGMSTDIDWSSLLRYFASPWFTRLWVVQEASLPAKSICHRGTSTRPLEDVLRVAIWAIHKASTLPHDSDSIRGLKCAAGIAMYADHAYGRHEILYHRGKLATTIELLIGTLSDYDTHDARDHVYGMLGLYRKYMRPTELPPALVPDYRAPISKIFCDVTRLIITGAASLSALRDVRRRPKAASMGEWASWVPQWHFRNDKYSTLREVNISGICADANVKLDVSSLGSMNDPNVLTVKGIILSTVSHTTPEFTRHRFEIEGAKAMRGLLNCACDIDSKLKLESQRDSDRLPHTLITGLDGYIQRIAERRSTELYTAFRHYIFELDKFPCGLNDVSDSTPVEASNAANFSQALANATFDRCIFSTLSGLLGRGPSILQIGDVVAILFGSSFPFVLRPLNLQHNKYEVIGYCYVYGIMEGEAVHAHKVSGQDDAIFHLC